MRIIFLWRYLSVADGHIHQFVAGDDSGLAGLSRVLNLEGNDHETIHLLIFLLMQFLSRPDQAFPSDEKSTAKTQAIVLRHLYLLLGYSQQENTFYFPPQKLRLVFIVVQRVNIYARVCNTGYILHFFFNTAWAMRCNYLFVNLDLHNVLKEQLNWSLQFMVGFGINRNTIRLYWSVNWH